MFGRNRRRDESASSSMGSDNTAHVQKDRQKDDFKRRVRNTSQSAIAYDALYESGICDLGSGRYSIMLHLGDISYQALTESAQSAILDQYALWLNSFDAQASVQLTIVNRILEREVIRRQAEQPLRGDELDGYRMELNQLTESRLEQGRANTVTSKYATISIQAGDLDEARTRLMQLAGESMERLREVGGCEATIATGPERVAVLHSIMRPDSRLEFDYAAAASSGVTTKDAIAPWMIDFTNPRQITLASERDTFMKVLFLEQLPSWLSDMLIRDLTALTTDLVVSLHARPIDTGDGIRLVGGHVADMDIQMANEQRKLVKQRLSADLVPHSLQRARQEAVELRRELETSNQKLFSTTLVVAVQAHDEDELERRVDRVKQVGRKLSCGFVDMRYMQEPGMNAVLPLGKCDLPLFRTMTTGSLSMLVPFATEEIFQPGGTVYGVNKISRNLVVGDRTQGMNGNSFTLGTSGSGKSMYCKNEIAQTIAGRPNDEIIIIDPEREYVPLAQAFGGHRIEINAGSDAAVNPMELIPDPDEKNPEKRKSAYVLSLMEALIGGSKGLSPQERSIIDRSTMTIYREMLETRRGRRQDQQPTLLTLLEELSRQPEPEARSLATSLELYASGSFGGFAQPTNIDRSPRLTLFDISELGSDMMTFGMLVVLEEIWGRVIRNKQQGRRTWLYIDEVHLLFANPSAAQQLQAIFKRARKYGLMCTGITQNIAEVLASEEARNMLSNAYMLTLLAQEETDAQVLQELFAFSEQQARYFRSAPAGHGLIRLGSSVVPFDGTIPTNTQMYQLFSTKFREEVYVA